MTTFADRMISAIDASGNPCVVGLDPRIDLMPDFVTRDVRAGGAPDDIRCAITNFHERVIGLVAPVVPAVKLQIAFYEQYGIPGMQAFLETISLARAANLMVLVDAKRNDIDSTAQAYANAFLGGTTLFGRRVPAFDADCLTVSPFLGRDSIEPFVRACREHGRGIFVLVKTSNPGSSDIQDRDAGGGSTISGNIARLVNELGEALVGDSGYSSIGAVVGATYPDEAVSLRAIMPKAIILVPGYGAQGGTGAGAAANFNADGRGALVNASRGVTYSFGDPAVTEADFDDCVRRSVTTMADDVSSAVLARMRLSA